MSTKMTETRRVSRFPHALLDQRIDPQASINPAASVDDTAPKSKPPPKKVSFGPAGSLASSRKPEGVIKVKAPKLKKDNVRRRDENPWETYDHVLEIVRNDDTVTKVRKKISSQVFDFRTFPVDEKFEIIEQQFKLLDHHNVLPAQEFFRHGSKGLIRSPVMDVSFDRIVICRQYPSSRVLACMMGQIMDGLGYLVSNGIICNSLTCSKILANKDGCVKIVAFADAEMQKDICAPTTILMERLALIMVLLMQKFENGPGEIGIQDHARWPPQDEACKFLQSLQKGKDFHNMHHHPFIDPKKRDGNGFKDLVERTSDTTLELHVRLAEEEQFHPV